MTQVLHPKVQWRRAIIKVSRTFRCQDDGNSGGSRGQSTKAFANLGNIRDGEHRLVIDRDNIGSEVLLAEGTQ